MLVGNTKCVIPHVQELISKEIRHLQLIKKAQERNERAMGRLHTEGSWSSKDFWWVIEETPGQAREFQWVDLERHRGGRKHGCFRLDQCA